MAKSTDRIGFGINPMFKLLLWINTALCVGTLTVIIAIAFSGSKPMPKAMERLLIVCEHVFTLTSGAFVGLLGGRVSAPDRPAR
jgi:hypothetical protein